MERVMVSTMVNAPIERVWEIIRDFNGLPKWMGGMEQSEIEGGGDPTEVGAIRSVTLAGSDQKLREKLVELSDTEYVITYAVLEGPIPVKDVVTRIKLRRVTDTNTTYGEWSSEFRTEPGGEQEGIDFLTRVFKGGWRQLKRYLRITY